MKNFFCFTVAVFVVICSFGQAAQNLHQHLTTVATQNPIKRGCYCVLSATYENKNGPSSAVWAWDMDPKVAASKVTEKAVQQGLVASRAARVDVVGQIQKIDLKKDQITVGEHGLVHFVSGTLLLPEEVAMHRLVNSKGKINKKRLKKYLKENKLGFRAPDLQDNWYRMTTDTSWIDQSTVRNLSESAQASYPKTTKVKESVNWGGAYLANAVKPTGQMRYIYDAKNDHTEDDYNLVRHAGTIWALQEYIRWSKNADLQPQVDKAYSYLDQFICVMPGQKQALAVDDAGAVKLGGVALACLAYLERYEALGTKKDLEKARGLGESILAFQKPDGSFYHKKKFDRNGKSQWGKLVSLYYSGEAIFALSQLGRVDFRDTRWTTSALKGAHYLSEVRDEKTVPFDHWLMHAYVELVPKDTSLYEHAMRIGNRFSERMLEQRSPKNTASLGTQAEALVSAYRIAQMAGNLDDAERFRPAVDKAFELQLKRQIRPEQALLCQDSKKALGAFVNGERDSRARIDSNQHNISALVRYNDWVLQSSR